MFSLSKGEPPTPPSTTTDHSDVPQLQKTETPIRSQCSSEESTGSSSTDQPLTETPAHPSVPPKETDSGFEASPSCMNEFSSFFVYDENVFDEVFEPKNDNDESFVLADLPDDDESCTDAILLEREDNDEAFPRFLESEDFHFQFDDNIDDDVFVSECPDCGEIPCSCSRAESSATVLAAVSSYTDPNTCDSDSSVRSSSPPPSSWSIPVPCHHNHNDRLPCPRCSGDETLETSSSSSQNIVTSRSYPGSYPSALLNWWTRSSAVFSPRTAAAQSRTSNRSDDRRNTTRSRRRQIDSDASASSSCDENSSDELFTATGEDVSYLEGTMTEAEELRVTSPEQLPDLVPLSSESSSRRARSQSVSIPLDHEYLREIGISLRRFSNEFENNRFAERNGQSRRSSLTSFLNLNWRS